MLCIYHSIDVRIQELFLANTCQYAPPLVTLSSRWLAASVMCACFLLVSGLVSMKGPILKFLEVLFSRICFISGDTHWRQSGSDEKETEKSVSTVARMTEASIQIHYEATPAVIHCEHSSECAGLLYFSKLAKCFAPPNVCTPPNTTSKPQTL